MSNLLIIGGFTESRRLLEPVAEEAIEQGLGHDAEVLTLRDAVKIDDERLRRLAAGMNIITHSAGITAVPDARQRSVDSELPNGLVVIAGPEPRSVGRLVRSASRKTYNHIFGGTAYPHRAHMRVVVGNAAELAAHPFVNFSLVPNISGFSTMNRLYMGQAAAIGRLGNFMMADDVFYANPRWREYAVPQSLQRNGCVIGELAGSHDELLLNPKGVLRGIRGAFGDAKG